MALESQPIPDKTRLAPFGQPDARFALTGRSDQATWNEGTALNITNGQQFLGTLGLNNFRLASNSPTDLPTPAADASSGKTRSDLVPPVETRPGELVQPVTSRPSTDLAQPVATKPPPESTRQPAPAGPPPLDAHFSRDNPTPPNFDWIQPRKGGLDEARDSLTRTADSVLPPDQAAAFRANMKQFERRAQTDHLSDGEVQSTYEATERLLKAKTGAASVNNMHSLARQIMEEAANPNKARTGYSTGSCGPVGLESLTYQNHPAAAADLVTQAAITGKFHTRDGLTVQADITPTYESQHPDTHSQNYASQIFQSVALNVGLKGMGDDRTFHMQYGKVTDGNGSYYLDSKGNRTAFDGTSADLMLASYHALTGQNDLAMIVNGTGESTANIKYVNSPEEMQRTVAELASRNTPTIVGLDARNQPFWTQSNGTAEAAADRDGNYAHWISLKGYDQNIGSVAYHNGWDDVNHQISPTDLFRATRQVDGNLPDMGNDFVKSLGQGNGNYAEALEALRIRSETGRISDYDLNRLLNRDVDALIAQRGSHFLDDLPTRNTIFEIASYLAKRNPKAFTPSPLFREKYNSWADSHQDD